MSAERAVSQAVVETAPRRGLVSRLNESAGRWAAPMAIVVLILGVWELCVLLFDIKAWLLPAPSAIATALVQDAGLLLRHSWVTLEEVIVGFAVALACGVSLGVGIALSRTVERSLYPFVIASQTIPIIVIAPLLLIWFGYGLTPKIIVVALIAFFPLAVNTVDGLKSVDPDTVNLLRTLGASRLQILLKAQLPTALPYLFSGARVAVAVSVIGAVHRRVGRLQRGSGLPHDPLQAAVSHRARLRRDNPAVRDGRGPVSAGGTRRAARDPLVPRPARRRLASPFPPRGADRGGNRD